MLLDTTNIESYKVTLKIILLQFCKVPEIQINEFVNLFSLSIFPKKTIIIDANTIKNNKIYFIINGLVRIYYNAEGKEITSDFKEKNSFFINGYTLFTGLPNIDYHEALEDTICLVADYNNLENLSKKYHSIEHLGRKLVEKYYTIFLKDTYNKLFLSADERYSIFIKQRASILNQISLRHVASHLGITPETLSRMRAKYQNSKP